MSIEKIKITSPYIKLDQLLKYGNVAEHGAMAKQMIQDGLVMVNGELAIQRGKKIRSGDIVEISGYGKIEVE